MIQKLQSTSEHMAHNNRVEWTRWDGGMFPVTFVSRATHAGRYATKFMRTGITSATSFFIAFFILGAAGCYPIPKEFSKDDLVGVYVLRYSFGVEELRINPDGSYVQTFTGRHETENSGKWQQDKTHLLLGDALLFTDPFGKPLEKPEKGNIGLGTAWYLGRFVLDANPDRGFVYEKQS